MVTEDTSRLVSPHGVPSDAHLTYRLFTPTWLTSTTGSVRTVADVCNLIIEVHFSSGSRKLWDYDTNREICKTFFLTTGQRGNVPLPFLNPPLHLIRLKYIQNFQINKESCCSYYSYQVFQNNGMSSMTICNFEKTNTTCIKSCNGGIIWMIWIIFGRSTSMKYFVFHLKSDNRSSYSFRWSL